MIEQVDKRRLLDDFKALLELNKPFIHRSLHHKIQELKVTLSTGQYTEETPPPHTGPKKIDTPPKSIDYEIYKIGTLWLPLIPEIPDINPYTILPLAIIDYIVENTEGGIIGFKKLVQVKNHAPVKISFQQESQNLIKGTIEKIENINSPGNNQVEFIEPKSNKQDDLQTFLEYLLSPSPENDAFTAYIVREFFIKWKPLLDSGCIDLNRLINVV